MGRLVISWRVGTMHLVLYWCIVCVSIAPLSVSAELDIYPEFADEVVVRRIQDVLKEWRENQLRILRAKPKQVILPDFTFQFPNSVREYQDEIFAVPPSNIKYYQQAHDFEEEEKRTGTGEETIRNNQFEAPKTTESWSEENTSDTLELHDEPIVERVEDVSYIKKFFAKNDQDLVLVAIIAGCGAAAVAGVIALSVGWYKLHNSSKAAADIEYPAYGVTGPNKEITPTGDRRLAQSAQMYHYQHQKQQIIAMESNRVNNERRGSVSDGDSEEENEEGDYTVYECPGLAAAGELEVKNPLFLDDPTPASGNHVEELPSSDDKTHTN